MLILLGALLYATGPITIGLVATDSGAAIARAWASAVALLIALPVVWATLFAVGALLVGDAGTAGPLIAGNSSVGSLLGGVLLAVAGAASLWMCLRAAREAMGLLRMQLGGLARAQPPRAEPPARPQPRSRARPRRCGASARGWRRPRAAPAASWHSPAPAAPRSCAAAAPSAIVARHGVLGTAAAGGRAAAGTVAPHTAALVGRSRAGAVAVRMAKAGTAGWYAAPAAQGGELQPTATSTPASAARARQPRIQTARRQPRAAGERPAPRPPSALPPRQPHRAAAANRARPQRACRRHPHVRVRTPRAPPTPPPPGRPTSHKPAPPSRGTTPPARGPATVPDGASDDPDAPAAERPRALLRADLARLGRARGLGRRSCTAPFGCHRSGSARTVTVVVLALAFVASIGLALQGQTIGPGRYLLALLPLPTGHQAARAADRAGPATASSSTQRRARRGRARARARRSAPA